MSKLKGYNKFIIQWAGLKPCAAKCQKCLVCAKMPKIVDCALSAHILYYYESLAARAKRNFPYNQDTLKEGDDGGD
jgi:hypothetical protein